jgi:excisionase family DNA binding protein
LTAPDCGRILDSVRTTDTETCSARHRQSERAFCPHPASGPIRFNTKFSLIDGVEPTRCAARGRPAQGASSEAQDANRRWLVFRESSGEELAMKIWLNVAEAAEYAGVSRDTIYTACERREIHYARIGGRRAIRLKPEWIDAWLERYARRVEAFGEASMH